MSAFRSLLVLAGLTFAINANATPITGSSLQGSTGYLDISLVSGTNYDVTWRLDTTGFNDALATSTGHTYLTEVAFKIAGMTSATLKPVSSTMGTLYFSANVSNAGCSSGSPAGFACVSLSPAILATTDQVISVAFNVDLDHTFDFNETISFRGKYGLSNGWVISESGLGTPGPAPVPEPSILVLLGLGLAGLGLSKRRLVG